MPRIPPARIGIGAVWHAADWTVGISLTEALDQDDTATGELKTDGHTLLDFYADWHFDIGGSEMVLFARGSNLLDEEVRNHTAFLKNYAPEPGLGIMLGVRYAIRQ